MVIEIFCKNIFKTSAEAASRSSNRIIDDISQQISWGSLEFSEGTQLRKTEITEVNLAEIKTSPGESVYFFENC